MTRRPALGRQPIWSFPRATESILDNGARVWAFDLPGQYVISAALALDLPLTAEPPRVEGVAGVTAHTLDEGTLSHPGPTFSEVLESTGAVFGSGVTLLATHTELDVPVTGLADALPLLAEAVREPALSDEDVMRHVGLRRAEIQQILANSAHLAATLTPGAIFELSARASRPAGGTSSTVEEVGPETVRTFHSLYSPRGATIVIAGDFAGQDPVRLVEQSFADWSVPSPPVAHEHAADAARGRRLVGRPGAVQADVRIAAPAIDRQDPRWAAFHVACTIMGGTFQSRLNTDLRERRGYTYGVRMGATPLRHGGYATVSGSFRTEVVPAAVDRALELLDAVSAPFTAREVDRAVSYLIRTIPLRAATAADVTQQAVVLATMGLDWRAADLSEKLAAVTPEEATAAFTEIWPADPAVLVVGDPALSGPLGLEAEPVPSL